MEYCFFRTIGKYTFCIIECSRRRALNVPKKSFFHTSDYLHSADSLKNIFGIPPFFNSQFSGGNTRKLRVFFLHRSGALEVKNRVQFAWAKMGGVLRVFSKPLSPGTIRAQLGTGLSTCRTWLTGPELT